MASADKILPHVIGSIDGDGSNLMIGWKDGAFYLYSISFQNDMPIIEEILYQDNWDNFISLIAVEMGSVITADPDDASVLSLSHLEDNSDTTQAQGELVRRAKQCIRDFNNISRILYRQGIFPEVAQHEARRADGFDSFSHMSAKFMREVK